MKLQKPIAFALCLLLIQTARAQKAPSNVLVHFEFDKSNIHDDDLAALKAFKATHPNIESITIDGWADTTGTDNYNYSLSERRCAAVKLALNYDETITEVLMRVGAHGEKDQLFQTDPENRVVIVAINDKKTKLAEQKRIQDSIAAAAVQKAKADSIAQVQQQIATQPKPVAQPKPASLVPKVIGDDASGLFKLLRDAKAGESVVLSDIHFEEGRHVLLKSSKPVLDSMLDALKKLPTLELEIQGHICCNDMLAVDGLDVDTKEFLLSYNRAKTVYDFMVENGIDASRLTYKGFGTRKRIVYPEKTDTDRDKNRRVEFLIVKR
ncbi:MAG TPA: OmpA family protein [Parafilimonas sp.]|jgi:outer membrane protein OmpA-like peptidoglycan-associated protein